MDSNTENRNKRPRLEDPNTDTSSIDDRVINNLATSSMSFSSSIRASREKKKENFLFSCTSDEFKINETQIINSYENLEQLKIEESALTLLEKIPTYKGI